MTEPLAQTITAEEAEILRQIVRTDDARGGYDLAKRLWRPIEVVEATGKARCRSCSETIPKGERCIKFGFDPWSGDGSWGRLSSAYLHLNHCPEGGST